MSYIVLLEELDVMKGQDFIGQKKKRQTLAHTIAAIRNHFGTPALLHAVSYTDASTAIKRDRLVGGHLT